MELSASVLDRVVQAALAEDVGDGDVTTESVVPAAAHCVAALVLEEPGVVCGLVAARAVFGALDPSVRVEFLVADGAAVELVPVPVARIEGSARAVLSGERTALNLVSRLSGIATLTARYVAKIAGTGATLLDTRKTTPGLRALERYAVRCGGGSNHRAGLYDAVLVKENHLRIVGGIGPALEALSGRTGLAVEVETETLEEVAEALAAGAHRILLDNMSPEAVHDAVSFVGGRVQLEASGGDFARERPPLRGDRGRFHLGRSAHPLGADPRSRARGPVTAIASATLAEEVRALALERDAVILAHNYQRPEVQDVADYVGDSLGLARLAAASDHSVIVLCGVHFMAETAAILCPEKTVLIPDPKAGCSLASSIDAQQLREWKAKHPGAVVVSVRQHHGRGEGRERLLLHLGQRPRGDRVDPGRPGDPLPPRSLSRPRLERVTGRKLRIWMGECHVHAGIRPADIERWQREAPEAEFLVHPECGCASQAMAFGNERTHILSTEGMLDFARRSSAKRFVVATETGILHRLNGQLPDKRFEAAHEAAVCRFMKMITLEKLRDGLRDLRHEVVVEASVASRARLAIERMVSIG